MQHSSKGTSVLETISNGGIEAGRNQFHEKSSSLAAVLIAQFAYTSGCARKATQRAPQRGDNLICVVIKI
jgi:hypothetical protein